MKTYTVNSPTGTDGTWTRRCRICGSDLALHFPGLPKICGNCDAAHPDPVPDWVHMADVPPTDGEPWTPGNPQPPRRPNPSKSEEYPVHVTPVGGWLLVAFVVLLVIGAIVWRVLR